MTRIALSTIVCVVVFALPKTWAVDSKPTNLFNGKDLAGWHVDVPYLDDHPDAQATFVVRNGVLVSLGQPGGHLITDKIYENYRLEVEYRFASKPGNYRWSMSPRPGNVAFYKIAQ